MSLGLGIFLSTLLVVSVLSYRWFGERWQLKKKFKIFAIWTAGVVGVIALAVWGFNYYANRPTLQTSYYGTSLGMSKSDVQYVLGLPTAVLEPVKDQKTPGWMLLIEAKDIPAGKRINDYDAWGYSNGEHKPRIDVSFDSQSKKVKRIGCYSGNGYCNSILRITTGTSEETVVENLGKPSKETISGVTKTMYYKDINLELILEKKEVYMLSVTNSEN